MTLKYLNNSFILFWIKAADKSLKKMYATRVSKTTTTFFPKTVSKRRCAFKAVNGDAKSSRPLQNKPLTHFQNCCRILHSSSSQEKSREQHTTAVFSIQIKKLKIYWQKFSNNLLSEYKCNHQGKCSATSMKMCLISISDVLFK